jgi:16S rRNA (cytosine1402-N4)-methyltransferase
VHQPVLVQEVLKYLSPQPGEVVIDATIGLGGHSELFLEKIQPNGRLIGIDLDKESLFQTQTRLNSFLTTGKEIGSIDLFCDNFVNIGKILERLRQKGVDIIFLDLGISSYQLETSHRGFSFLKEAILDMRMSLDNPLTAQEVINKYSLDNLIKIFRFYGEERFSKHIAQRIITYRKRKKITSTIQLAEIVKSAVHYKGQRIHPATRVFQAIRIEVNKELDNLKGFLERIVRYLNPRARVGIISFHSLEDRLVKESFRNYQKQGPLEIITKKPIVASLKEKRENPASRSAKLRVAMRKNI